MESLKPKEDMTSYWDELRQGISPDSEMTIRLARKSDGRRVEDLLRLAVKSHVLERLCGQVDKLGDLVAAFSRADVDQVETFWRTPHSLDSMITAGSFVIIAEKYGQVVGAACAGVPWRILTEVSERPDRVDSAIVLSSLARLNAVGVSPHHRKSGVGSALVQACIRLLDDAGYGAISGQCAPALAPFYAQLGFDISRPGEPVSFLREVPALTLVRSDDPDECTLIKRLREFPNEHTTWRLPFVTPDEIVDRSGGRARVEEGDDSWETTILDIPESSAPVLRVSVPEGTGPSLGLLCTTEAEAVHDELSRTIRLFISPGKVVLYLNDSSVASEENAPQLMIIEPLSTDDWEWITAVAEIGWTVFTMRPSATAAGVSGKLAVTITMPAAPAAVPVNVKPGLLVRIRAWFGR